MRFHKPVWRSPEEIVEIGFQRSQVVMMNEAHSGLKRCIRTRQIGQQILPAAHRAGVRHLAMEALYPEFAEACNEIRRPPDEAFGYLSQPEIIEFIQTALDLGWTLIPYEDDFNEWLAIRHGIKALSVDDPTQLDKVLEPYQADMLSMEYTNWREEQQARNLIAALDSLPSNTPMLVWCGNGHHTKVVIQDWIPMGYQFQQLSGINPFTIDQIKTVKFDSRPEESMKVVGQFHNEMVKWGGTAGFLKEEAPPTFSHNDGADAFLVSIYNEME